jgi:hypothetical protein
MVDHPSGQPAINTLLQYGDGACSETFSTLANVGNLGGPTMQRAVAKTTSHSTGVPWDTFIPTVIDPGQIPFDLFFKPNLTSHKTALGFFENGDFLDWRIVFPDVAATKWYFTGFFSKFSISAAVADAIKAAAAVQVSGKIYFD